MTQPDYAMVTVKLGHEQVDRAQAYTEIKSALGLKAPAMDDSFGAIPMGKGDEYVVLVEEKLAAKMFAEKHPNIIGVFSNPKMEPFNPALKKRANGGPGF